MALFLRLESIKIWQPLVETPAAVCSGVIKLVILNLSMVRMVLQLVARRKHHCLRRRHPWR
jgi:hypothetical protein